MDFLKAKEMKLGTIVPNQEFGNLGDLLKEPIKLVKIGYTFQDSDGTQCEICAKTKDFVEPDEEEVSP